MNASSGYNGSGDNNGDNNKHNNNNNNNNNHNNKGKQLLPPPSPMEDTTCASSSASASAQDIIIPQVIARRQRLARQTTHLSIASGASLVTLVVTSMPTQLLLQMSLVLALVLCLLFKVYQRAALEYQLVVQGRGFGQYLPPSIYDQLMHMSLHEWMSDGSFMEEYAYLMLYLIPGLSPAQVDNYINRLSPRHRRLLRRPGLGHMLGEGFMRILEGDAGADASPPVAAAAAARLVEGAPNDHPASVHTRPVPRRLELLGNSDGENTSHLGDEHEDDFDQGRIPDPSDFVRFLGLAPVRDANNGAHQAPPTAERVVARAMMATMAATPATTRSSDNHEDDKEEEEEEEENLADEFNILTDAFTDSITGYYTSAYNSAVTSVSTVATSSLSFFAGSVMRTSLSITFVSAGIGLFGMWTGVYDPRTIFGGAGSGGSSRLPLLRPSWPSSSLLLSTTIASGATASILMMFGAGRNYSSKNDSTDNSSKDNKDGKSTS
jgi:hypothetical protein